MRKRKLSPEEESKKALKRIKEMQKMNKKLMHMGVSIWKCECKKCIKKV